MKNLKKYKKTGFFIFVFIFSLLCVNFYCFALDLEKLKACFIRGDYTAAITEGEKILAQTDISKDLDELYYILGLSYLKDGNYLRASDIFEIILQEFKDSGYKDEALIGLGDAYFLKGDYDKAEARYKELLNGNPHSRLLPAVYYRFSQIGFKRGDMRQGKDYLDKLRQDYPLNLETMLNKELTKNVEPLSELYYTVQVGCFSKAGNADRLSAKLAGKGYSAYIQESGSDGKKVYKVKVGKLKNRSEAVQLENRLSSEGYPTKISP